MANIAHRLQENVEGDFYVDSTCIDCDACRQIAPTIFRDHGDQSSVYQQPETEEETRRALMAIVACPTSSIGTTRKYNARIGSEAFPTLISENVYFCGFTSESSFGAWSYLIVRPPDEGGNILVDSPRFSRPLVKKIKALGGATTMFLTHRDDIADHAAFNREFGAARIMHVADGAARHGFERIIEGDAEVRLDDDLTVIPVPGHTRGHAVLLYRNKFLFTGDHLAWSPAKETLTAFKSACWYSWPEQTRSMEKLLDYDFEWVLPGHGRIHQDTPAGMQAHL
ncbi:MAG: MBL fold metallo-hydrolase, partial [Acidobacteria bacterium]|nr:MBL fold metallo-hydrolase [Acidobacteriota bacterium]